MGKKAECKQNELYAAPAEENNCSATTSVFNNFNAGATYREMETHFFPHNKLQFQASSTPFLCMSCLLHVRPALSVAVPLVLVCAFNTNLFSNYNV